MAQNIISAELTAEQLTAIQNNLTDIITNISWGEEELKTFSHPQNKLLSFSVSEQVSNLILEVKTKFIFAIR